MLESQPVPLPSTQPSCAIASKASKRLIRVLPLIPERDVPQVARLLNPNPHRPPQDPGMPGGVYVGLGFHPRPIR